MEKIDSLTGIRAFAAIWVVLFHCMGDGKSTSNVSWLNALAEKGGTAVDLFYVLSGFIMVHVYADKMSKFTFEGMRNFLWRRFARIYPAHFTVLMLFLVIVVLAILTGAPYTVEYHTARKFFYQLFMLNGIGIPDSNGWNFPSWTISSEFVAYIAFPFLIVLTTRLKKSQSLSVIVIIYGVMFILAFWFNGGESYYLPWPYILTRIGSQFTVGCLLYNFASLFWIKRIASWAAPITFILIIIIPILFPHEMMIGLLAMLYAILILTIANDRSSILARFLSSRPMVFLGEISFSLYIAHNFTLLVLNQVAKRLPFLEETFLHGSFKRFLLDLILAAIGGAILHKLLEVPARRWLTKLPHRYKRKNVEI